MKIPDFFPLLLQRTPKEQIFKLSKVFAELFTKSDPPEAF